MFEEEEAERLIEHEISFWTPSNITGTKIKSLDELKSFLKVENGEVITRFNERGYDIFFLNDQKIAYNCKGCESIVIGPYRVKKEIPSDNIAGSIGLVYFCVSCYSRLGIFTLKLN